MRIPEKLKMQLWQPTKQIWCIAAPTGILLKTDLYFFQQIMGEDFEAQLQTKYGATITTYPHFSFRKESDARNLKTELNKRFKQHLINKHPEFCQMVDGIL